jgi:hypothetical protein
MLVSHRGGLGSVPREIPGSYSCIGAGTAPSWFPVPITVPPLLHAVCDSPDQTAHYHALGTKLGASSVTWSLVDLTVKVYKPLNTATQTADVNICAEVRRFNW